MTGWWFWLRLCRLFVLAYCWFAMLCAELPGHQCSGLVYWQCATVRCHPLQGGGLLAMLSVALQYYGWPNSGLLCGA